LATSDTKSAIGVNDTITIPPAIMPAEWRLGLSWTAGGSSAGGS
jgi:hypothetical protein